MNCNMSSNVVIMGSQFMYKLSYLGIETNFEDIRICHFDLNVESGLPISKLAEVDSNKNVVKIGTFFPT